jgi:hypothetical protein
LHYTPENKQQSQKWHHAYSGTKENNENSSRHVQLQKSWSVFSGAGKAFF